MRTRHCFIPGTLLFAILLAGSATSDAQAQIGTSMTLSASPTTVYPGNPVTLTATVTVASGSIGSLQGSAIDFYQNPESANGFSLGYINNGVATATITPNVSGSSATTISIAASLNVDGYEPAQATVNVNVLPISSTTLQAGQYIFLLQGFQFPEAMAAVGSLAFDGNGNVSGEEDLNRSAGASLAVLVTGTYAFASTGMGVLKLHGSTGDQQFAVFLPSPLSPTTPSNATLLETDGSALSKGILMLQTNGYLPSIGGGMYALDVKGEALNYVYGHDAGPVFVSGQLSLGSPTDNTAIVGQASETIGTTLLPNLTLTGNYDPPDSQGRFLFTASAGPGYGDQPMHFVAYAIDSEDMVLMSLDPHTKFILLSGTGRSDR